MTGISTGTITFLFTDVEGSTKLWERNPEAMSQALAHHDELIRNAVEAHDGCRRQGGMRRGLKGGGWVSRTASTATTQTNIAGMHATLACWLQRGR